jgi:Malic enzyme, NAD binding domain
VDPDVAMEYAAVVATGRSDYPNQINNVLAFPGVFRGLLDAQSRLITDDMLIAAAQALADVVSPDEIGPHYIIPSVFHPDVTSSVAVAVADAANENPDRLCGRGRPESGPMIGTWTKCHRKPRRAACSSPLRCSGIPTSAGPSS